MTRFNILAGTTIVPIIARLILCAAFLTAGWNKLMNVQEFHGEHAQTLIGLGVADVIRTVPRETQPASLVTQDAPDEVAGDDASETVVPQPPPDVIEEDPITGEQVLIAKRLHGVTLMLLDRDFTGRAAIWLAWILAFTELVGGALLLIGLFSRVWALGLAIAMIGAFTMTSLPALIELGGPFGIAADMSGGYAAFHAMYAQLGLLALALAVLLAGPGPLSLDRLIFRPRAEEDAFDHDFVARRTRTETNE